MLRCCVIVFYSWDQLVCFVYELQGTVHPGNSCNCELAQLLNIIGARVHADGERIEQDFIILEVINGL